MFIICDCCLIVIAFSLRHGTGGGGSFVYLKGTEMIQVLVSLPA